MHIRAANFEDVPHILHILNHAIAHSTASYHEHPRSLEEQYRWFLNQEQLGFPILVAVIADKVVGFSGFGIFRPLSGFKYSAEHAVYIDEDYRGQGLGAALLTALFPYAQTLGIHTLIACIDSENHASIALHLKYGFREAGCLREVGFKFGRWLDLVLLQKHLNSDQDISR